MRTSLSLVIAVFGLNLFYQQVGATPSKVYSNTNKWVRPHENNAATRQMQVTPEEKSGNKSGSESGNESGKKKRKRSQNNHVTINSCNAAFCDPGWEPYPNIVSAMTGYNILKGNAYNLGTDHDPGFETGYIFTPVVKDDDGRYALHSGITIRAISKCDLTLKTKSVSTVKGYQTLNRAIEGSFEGWKANSPVEVSIEGKGGGAPMELPPFFEASGTLNSAQRENEEFFIKHNGVLTVNDATCALYSMQISRTSPPPFTEPFRKAVFKLGSASWHPEDVTQRAELQKKLFHRFIDEFGTHFLLKATIGARLSITRRYSRDTFKKANAEQIQNCNKHRLDHWFVKSQSNDTCTGLENTERTMIFNNLQREYILAYGSKPSDSLTDWANQDFESPLPIKMKLLPILDLFTSDFMEHDNDSELHYHAQVTRTWMEPLYNSYCEDMKDELGIDSCTTRKNTTRCGYNDDCNPVYQDCLQLDRDHIKCETELTKSSIQAKLKQVMASPIISRDMTANEVLLRLNRTDEIANLPGRETYILVMKADDSQLYVAGDNAVKGEEKGFKVAVAWASDDRIGLGRNFHKNVEEEISSIVCNSTDGSKKKTMKNAIKNINMKGHSVKFYIQAQYTKGQYPGQYIGGTDEKLAVLAEPHPDFNIQAACNHDENILWIGPGGNPF